MVEDKQVSISRYSTPQFLGLPNRARQVHGSTSTPSTCRQRGVWSQVRGGDVSGGVLVNKCEWVDLGGGAVPRGRGGTVQLAADPRSRQYWG